MGEVKIELLPDEELRERPCMDTVVFDYGVKLSANDFVKHLQSISYNAYGLAFASGMDNTDYEQVFIYRSCQMAIGAFKGFMARDQRPGISLMTDEQLEAWPGNDLIVFDYEKRQSANDFVELLLKMGDTAYINGTAAHPVKPETNGEFEQFYINRSCRIAIDSFRDFVHGYNEELGLELTQRSE